MAFPTTLSNLQDNVDSIIAGHINNIEAAIGITGSSVASSINYRMGDVDSGHKIWRVGDIKVSLQTEGYGFLEMDGRSIGPSGSGADLASDDYEDLFDFLVNTLGFTPTDTWGNGGTVDLPDANGKFLIHENGTYSIGSTGGASSINLQHSHTVNSHTHAGPSHTHAFTGTAASGGIHGHTYSGTTSTDPGTPTGGSSGTNKSAAHSHTYSGTTANSTGHTHSVSGTTDAEGNGNTGVASNSGMDNQLSATQSIVNPYLSVRFLIKF